MSTQQISSLYFLIKVFVQKIKRKIYADLYQESVNQQDRKALKK